jgi:hypothetical protein
MPSLVPTEGNRPPTDDLLPAAEPQSAPAQTARRGSGEGLRRQRAARGFGVGRPIHGPDRRPNDLTIYDTEELNIVGSVPAGHRPPHQVGKVAQPGGPYGIAYDRTRDLLWVASSGTNEVLGYDMSRPTPREVRRLPTPYTLGVDAQTGRPYIAG